MVIQKGDKVRKQKRNLSTDKKKSDKCNSKKKLSERKRNKAKKRKQNYKKKQNQLRVQRRSLKKLGDKCAKYFKHLSRFVEGEEPKTLWSKAKVKSLAKYLEKNITDPRKKRGQRHKLKNVLVMILYATICGCKSYEAIADWLKSREDELTVMLGLEHGVPTASTFCRIMQKISFEELHRVFNEWAKKTIPGFRRLINKKVNLHLSADGKAIRALTEKCEGKTEPPYMLNAYLYNPILKIGFCIASLPINKKTNEAKSLIPFLKHFVPKGSIVTIDAAGAYQETLDTILEAGAQALICVKGNQSKLEESAVEQTELAERRIKEEAKAIESFYKETGYRQRPSGLYSRHHEGPEYRHGRREERDYVFSNDLTCINTELWPQIKGVGCVERQRMEGKTIRGNDFIMFTPSKICETTLHCYMSTIELDAATFAELVRAHWFIEARLHGILDGPAFTEDRARMRTGEAMENMAIVRRFAYNILELLYLDFDPEKRPSFEIRMNRIRETRFGIEETLFKKKACMPKI